MSALMINYINDFFVSGRVGVPLGVLENAPRGDSTQRWLMHKLGELA
jgi:hypothetical protein